MQMLKMKVRSTNFKSFSIDLIVSGHPCMNFYNGNCFGLLCSQFKEASVEKEKWGFLGLMKKDHGKGASPMQNDLISAMWYQAGN